MNLTVEFKLVSGLKLGMPLSPLLFNLAQKHIIRKVTSMTALVEVNGQHHKVIGYVDDIALLGANKREVIDTVQFKKSRFCWPQN